MIKYVFFLGEKSVETLPLKLLGRLITMSRNRSDPLGAATVAKKQGMYLFMPAILEALMRGISSMRLPPYIVEITVSTPVRASVKASSGPLRSAATISTPFFFRAITAGF